jgi:alkanesulfonate monooxygenase SsuD/methylene tetrahydromethanopterin reductase-like flavin-dependent oxidoreductase (luciferase family)
MEMMLAPTPEVSFDGTSRTTLGLFVVGNFAADEDVGQCIREQREQLVAAREAGFTSIAVGQHFLTHPIHTVAAVSYAASLADITGDMRVILGVMLLPLLDPVLLAEDVSTLDWITGGRVVFGTGIGYRPEEFRARGVSLHDRVGLFNESLKVIKAIWTADPTWSFAGKHFQFDGLPGGLRPKQKPYPPIWVATDVDPAVRRAARLGAAWYINPRAKPEFLKRQLAMYEETLEESGHSKPKIFPIRREAFVGRTDAEARRIAVQYLKRMLAFYEAWGQYDIMPEANKKDRDFDEDAIPDTYLVGTPDRVAEMILRYREELGVNHFVLRMRWPGMPHREVMKSIDLMGSKVIPSIA